MMDNNYYGGFEADYNDARAYDYIWEEEGWENYEEEEYPNTPKEKWTGTTDVLPF